jgi:hypothetical protein
VDTLLIIIFVLFGFGIFAYFFLMMFYPEWVGITGSDTKLELEKESQELAKKKAAESAPTDSGSNPT